MTSELLDPDMPAQAIRLHMGELTASELKVARAAIRWANTRKPSITRWLDGLDVEKIIFDIGNYDDDKFSCAEEALIAHLKTLAAKEG